jgi:hypothetical protein
MSGDADIYDAVMAGGGANRQTVAIRVGAQVSDPLGHQLFGRRGEFVSHGKPRRLGSMSGQPILPFPTLHPDVLLITK